MFGRLLNKISKPFTKADKPPSVVEKTKASFTDTEIHQHLHSKDEYQVNKALEELTLRTERSEDISPFLASILNANNSASHLISTKIAVLVENLADKRRDEFLLIYNSLEKQLATADSVTRLEALKTVLKMKNQAIALDLMDKLLSTMNDYSPSLRRLAVIGITLYHKQLEFPDFNLEDFVSKALASNHAAVYSAVFLFLTEVLS